MKQKKSLNARIEAYLAQNAIGWTEFASLVGFSSSYVRVMKGNNFEHCSENATKKIEALLQSPEEPSTAPVEAKVRRKKLVEPLPPSVIEGTRSVFMDEVSQLDPDMDIMSAIRLLKFIDRQKMVSLRQFIALCRGAKSLDQSGFNLERLLCKTPRKPKRASSKNKK